ncbi:MAG: hypothetical protein UY51_C0005G0622 [Candidatus Jorgensenbacteria bacterium GW2011_GWB1_49_9]|nr:MAG: hypothetical protein UY51_C0005G0622 [Candidatus Jorgensenbacteria bacterium GW2011_GWB1_49_9]
MVVYYTIPPGNLNSEERQNNHLNRQTFNGELNEGKTPRNETGVARLRNPFLQTTPGGFGSAAVRNAEGR